MNIKTVGITVVTVLLLEAAVIAFKCLVGPAHPHELVFRSASVDAGHTLNPDQCQGVVDAITAYETKLGTPVPEIYRIVRRDGGPPKPGSLPDIFLEDTARDSLNPPPHGCAVQVGIGVSEEAFDKCMIGLNSNAVHSHFMSQIAQSKDLVQAVKDKIATMKPPQPTPAP